MLLGQEDIRRIEISHIVSEIADADLGKIDPSNKLYMGMVHFKMHLTEELERRVLIWESSLRSEWEKEKAKEDQRIRRKDE